MSTKERHIQGFPRNQLKMFSESIEDYVSEENPVRVIDAFVEGLDLKKHGISKAETAETGRKPYEPQALLKLYIWGYMNRVNSSRRLEREGHRNLEVKWLLQDLTPDDKTICNFRRENRGAMKGIFVEFRVLCQNLKLYGEKEVAIDRSKFKASNSKKRNKTLKKLKKRIKEIEEQVESYLSKLETNDTEEFKLAKENAQELRAKIDKLQERMREYENLVEELQLKGETQVSQSDPDSRSMVKSGSGGAIVGYNVQSSVDSKHSLIVDYEVTNAPNDMNQLSIQAKAAKEALGVNEIDILVDAGYHNGSELEACEQMEGVTVYAAPKASSAHTKPEIAADYALNKFTYDAESDTYQCPQGERLVHIGATKQRGVEYRTYGTKACETCKARDLCTENKQGRKIYRSQFQSSIDAVSARVAAEPDKTKRRGSIIEHTFGTIKNRDQGVFLTRSLKSVSAEFGLSALAYNMTRAVNLLGVPALLSALLNSS